MTDAAKGIWALAGLILFVLGIAFVIPLLVKLLILLPQMGWGLVG